MENNDSKLIEELFFSDEEALPEYVRKMKKTYNKVDTNYSSDWNENELQKNLPLVKRNIAKQELFLGVFGRKIKSSDLTCYQYLFVWKGQLFPPHPMDYAPVFIYNRKNKQPLTIFDIGHHYKFNVEIPKNKCAKFSVHPLWRAFRVSRLYDKDSEKCLKSKIYSLKELPDSYLNHWWNFDYEEAKLKITKKLMDPTLLYMNNRFDEPKDISSLESLAMTIRYHFVISSVLNKNLKENLKMLNKDFINNLAKRKDDDQFRKEFAGFASLLLLLERSKIIEFFDKSNIYTKLNSNIASFNYPIDNVVSELHHSSVNLNEDFKVSYVGELYYQKILDAIQNDDLIKQELVSWNQKTGFTKDNKSEISMYFNEAVSRLPGNLEKEDKDYHFDLSSIVDF